MGRARKRCIGSSFDDLLKEAGDYEQTRAVAIKRVLTWQLEKATAKERLTKNDVAKRMRTSRS